MVIGCWSDKRVKVLSERGRVQWRPPLAKLCLWAVMARAAVELMRRCRSTSSMTDFLGLLKAKGKKRGMNGRQEEEKEKRTKGQ